MKNKIDGVLLLNKPLGLSSNTALQKVKKLFNAEKAGHTGTLDPLATGLLPICFGEATKFSSFLLDGDKEYIAIVKLGSATTTYDAEGEVTHSNLVNVTIEQIQQCILSFTGLINQVPPIYSALKVNGKKLYEYARSGEEVVINSREITIHEIELLKLIEPDIIHLRILCSKGTYIRTLAHDMGISLGCYAHLIGLIRSKSNQFKLDEDITIESLQAQPLEILKSRLLPPDIMLQHLPLLDINDQDFDFVKHGHQFEKLTQFTEGKVRLYYQGKFLGVADCMPNIIKPFRLVNTVQFL